MFVEERHAQILEQLKADGMVRVKDLAVRFGVTEDLIRKDLAGMERNIPSGANTAERFSSGRTASACWPDARRFRIWKPNGPLPERLWNSLNQA